MLINKKITDRKFTDIPINSLKGTIFDVDGTILDSMPIWEKVGSNFLKNIGVVLHKEKLDLIDEKLFSMSYNDGITYLQENYATNYTKAEIKDYINKNIENFYKHEVKVKKPAKDLIEKLYMNKIPMVIATSGDVDLIRCALKRNGIDKYFSGFFSCNELHTNKDDPLIYIEAAKYIGERPNSILVVEDTYQGLHTAKTAGFITGGIYDKASQKDQENIKKETDYYEY